MRARFFASLLVVGSSAFGCASASTIAPPNGPTTTGPPAGLRTGPPPRSAPSAFAPPRAASASPRTKHEPASKEPRHVYRLDFLLQDGSAASPPSGRSYTMSLEEDRTGDLSIGSNVPVSPSNTRQDVGLRISARYVSAGDDLLLHTSLELSSAEDQASIHKMAAQSDVLLAPGNRALVASLDDPVGKQRYQLFATVTKMR
jgi:hypothetical protein